MIGELSRAASKGRLEAALQPYLQPQMLIIDEMGFISHAADAASRCALERSPRASTKRPGSRQIALDLREIGLATYWMRIGDSQVGSGINLLQTTDYLGCSKRLVPIRW